MWDLLSKAVDVTFALWPARRRPGVPSAADVQLLLQQELERYFGARRGSRVGVEHELLQQKLRRFLKLRPVASVWVRVSDDGRLDEGAARVAVYPDRFEVLEYLSVAEMRAQPRRIRRIFPRKVRLAIAARL